MTPPHGVDGAASTNTSRRLTALGPYFSANSHDPGSGTPEAPWHCLGELFDDTGAVAGRVEAIVGYLAAAGGMPSGAIEPRVAASVMQLGLAARTLSPVFALNVLGLRVDLPTPVSLRSVWWQPALGSMFALSIPGLDDARPSSESRIDEIGTLAAELCDLAQPFGVSPRVLWGNISSALNGARIAISTAEPGLAFQAEVELDRLLNLSALKGTSQTTDDGRFQRRSCCLMYRAAPDRRGPLCGDCVLARQER